MRCIARVVGRTPGRDDNVGCHRRCSANIDGERIVPAGRSANGAGDAPHRPYASVGRRNARPALDPPSTTSVVPVT